MGLVTSCMTDRQKLTIDEPHYYLNKSPMRKRELSDDNLSMETGSSIDENNADRSESPVNSWILLLILNDTESFKIQF